ncbi:MAG: radical SAM protein [Candidatus Omnitrophota bacterium]|jgi:MoaA/NifB/PqqE/SkfB family radical SAM enzyme
MKLLKELEKNLGYYFSGVVNAPLSKPHWIFVSLTHRCNYSCQMCGVSKILREHELDFGLLQKVFKEIAGWDSDCVMVFTGGEPFLRKDIFEIIACAVSLGIKTELVSNGSQIIDRAIARKIIRSGLSNIAISLDGASAKVHDGIRGVPGAFEMALDALGFLSEEKKLYPCGPQISVWTTIMKENVFELSQIIPVTRAQGVECLVYHPVIVTQDDMQNTIKSGHFWVTEEYIAPLKQQIEKIAAYQKKEGYVAFLHDPFLWLRYFQWDLTKEDWKCNPFVFIDIGPDAFVRSCGPAFGNVKEMTLSECLETKEANRARERMLRCDRPCLQTCWGRPEADALEDIVRNFSKEVEGLRVSKGRKKDVLNAAVALLSRYESMIRKDY